MNEERQTASSAAKGDEVDLVKLGSSVWKTFRRRWYFFIAVILLAGMLGGYIGTKGFRPTYTSEATFIVEIDGVDTYLGQSTSKILLAALPQVIMSQDMRELIADRLGDNYAAAALDASVIEDTNVLSVKSTGYTPESAYYTLTAALDIFPELAWHTVGKASVSYIIKPVLPVSSNGAASAFRSVAIGLVLGIVAVFGGIAVYTLAMPKFDSTDEIRRRFGFEKVCSVPAAGSADNGKAVIISDRSVNRRFYDAIGRMRSSVVHEARKQNIKTVLVTSTVPSEGKTTIAVNFALSLSQHGMKVLLVECDLRNPAMSDTIGAGAAASFSDVIRGRVKLSEALLRYNDNLDVICESEYNDDAAELITSDYVKKLMLTAREKYDFVIADTPPLTAASDAAVLAEYFDGFIYVIRSGGTSVRSVDESMENFRYCKARPLAAVLNMSSESGTGYGGYYGYYGYYGENGKGRKEERR